MSHFSGGGGLVCVVREYTGTMSGGISSIPETTEPPLSPAPFLSALLGPHQLGRRIPVDFLLSPPLGGAPEAKRPHPGHVGFHWLVSAPISCFFSRCLSFFLSNEKVEFPERAFHSRPFSGFPRSLPRLSRPSRSVDAGRSLPSSAPTHR